MRRFWTRGSQSLVNGISQLIALSIQELDNAVGVLEQCLNTCVVEVEVSFFGHCGLQLPLDLAKAGQRKLN